MAMPCSKQSFTTFETSSVFAGRTTTAAVPTSMPRQSRTNGSLPWSSRISPLSPTMARRPSSTAGVTGTVGMLGGANVSGIVFLSLTASLPPLTGAVIRGRAAQPVVDRKAQSGLRNRHDRDARVGRLVQGTQVSEQVGGRLGEVAADAEIEHLVCAGRRLGTKGQ